MIIVNISDGLGNQMFQYAFGYVISQKKDQVLKLNISSFETDDLRNYGLGLYNINTILATKKEVGRLKYKNENLFNKILRMLKTAPTPLSETYYKEQHFSFNENVYDLNGDIYFEGFWQSEKYFKEYREDILRQFILRDKIHLQSQKYKQKMKDSESVSLHIRRGDYITNTHLDSGHGTCTLEYYRNALLKIEEETKNPQFFIFSDDLDWAKKNFSLIDNITFVELANDVPDHEEMCLMSLCKHNIIANSTFSWWGAWLNQNPDKIVIAPKQWLNDPSLDTSDVVPEDWIRL